MHALGLRSLWDARLAEPGEEEALLTTWKFRANGESQRVIDYVWCALARTCAAAPLHVTVACEMMIRVTETPLSTKSMCG